MNGLLPSWLLLREEEYRFVYVVTHCIPECERIILINNTCLYGTVLYSNVGYEIVNIHEVADATLL
jgi:hypothetical protein